MKRSAIQRKTPMKPGTKPLQAKKPMNRGSGFAVKLASAASKLPRLLQAPAKARKPMKASKPQASPAERAYMGLVAALGCIVCEVCMGMKGTPALVHHVRTGQGRKRASNYDTIPLCPAHHDFHRISLHVLGVKRFAVEYGISELQLLAIIQAILRQHLPPDHAPPGKDPYAVPDPRPYRQ